MEMTCPKCRQTFEREQSKYFPFCSKRCQQLDFGAWVTGQYRVPAGPVTDADEEDPKPTEPGDDDGYKVH